MQVKHMLLCMLESFYALREKLSFMGNISQNSVIAQLKKTDLSESKLVKKSLNDDSSIDLMGFEAGLVYTHADMLSKSDWFQNKVEALKNNRK